MRGVGIYLRERFPVSMVALLSAVFALGSVGLFRFSSASVASGSVAAWAPTWPVPLTLLWLFLLYFALLLRYRVTDEWKDFSHDSVVYPNRPVQRGAVTPRALVALGMGATVVEFTAVGLVGGWIGLVLYLPILVYSLLTAVEFFARDWLSRHFTVSFLIHEFLYLPLFAWVAAVLGAGASYPTAAGVAALALLFVSIELARKFSPRYDPTGTQVEDTYGAVWGRSATLVVLLVVMLSVGVLALIAGAPPYAPLISLLVVGFALIRRGSDSWVTVSAAVHLPLIALVVFL
jgi:hypothetical protein